MALQPRGFLQQLAGWHLGPLLFARRRGAGDGAGDLSRGVLRRVAQHGGLGLPAGRGGARVWRGPWRAFFRVTLPLSLPAIGASVLLAFTLAIEEYGVPAALARSPASAC